MLSNYQIVLTATVGGRIRVGLAEEAIFKYSQGKALSTHTPDLLKADIIMFIAYVITQIRVDMTFTRLQT